MNDLGFFDLGQALDCFEFDDNFAEAKEVATIGSIKAVSSVGDGNRMFAGVGNSEGGKSRIVS